MLVAIPVNVFVSRTVLKSLLLSDLVYAGAPKFKKKMFMPLGANFNP